MGEINANKNDIPALRCVDHDTNTIPKALQHQQIQQCIQALQESSFLPTLGCDVYKAKKGEFAMVPEGKAHGIRAFRRLGGDYLDSS